MGSADPIKFQIRNGTGYFISVTYLKCFAPYDLKFATFFLNAALNGAFVRGGKEIEAAG